MAEAKTVSESDEPAHEDDPRWQLVERILANRDFQRSPRLSDFLRHVCQLTLDGSEDVISEQYLGEVLFGRAPGYDSTSDTIVRSHALRLRRRLENYFQRDGKSESLRLVIPRGGYVPLFIPASYSMDAVPDKGRDTPTHSDLSSEGPLDRGSHSIGPPATGLPNLASVEQPPFPGLMTILNRYRIVLTLSLCGVLGLIVLVIYQWQTLRILRTHEYRDRNHPLWSRLFNAEEPTQIVLGDSGLVLFHAASRQYVSLHDYVNNDFSKELPYVQHTEPQFALFLAGRRYTSLTDAMATVRLLRLPEARPDRTIVSFSRDMHLDDFKSGNIVMIGAQEADPWVELFERQMDFVFSIDTPDKHAVFLDRHPLKGESAIYSPEQDGPNQIYAVIAFLPNLTGTGNVLLLEGSNMAGTEAAVDLVMDDQRLIPILRGIQQRDGTLPHFEMMIATSVVKDSPALPRVVALHVHS